MTRRVLRLGGDAAGVERLGRRFEAIRDELGVGAPFPPEVLHEAQESAARPVPGPDDLTQVDFVTIDPPGSTDLDQAVHLARRPDGGFAVRYAIADVPAFVRPDGAIAAEAWRRGQTLYAPDRRVPLHPELLSEDAASLLPGVERLAFVWQFDLDGDGEVEHVDLARGRVRSRLRLDYATVQAAADGPDGDAGGTAEQRLLVEQSRLLAEVGRARLAQERRRGGAGLPMPEQEVVRDGDRFALAVHPRLPAEDWNAQLSLMTGMAAARIMLDGGAGLLRTMPPPEPDRVAAFRAQTARLGVAWPDGLPYGDFLDRLDVTRPREIAVVHAAAALFRGAGYTPVTASGEPSGAAAEHAAVVAPYAHVTAPLRRLVDRFGLVAAYHLSRGEAVPAWVREALAGLPEQARSSDRTAAQLDRLCTDAVEAAVLDGRVGEIFEAVVVETRQEGRAGTVQLLDPPVLASAAGPLELGAQVPVRLAACDPDEGKVAFEPAAGGPA